MNRIYCRAVLPNAGLANRLFPWARCVAYSRTHSLPMLAPIWPQIKLGPLLRREADKRLYVGIFRSAPNDIPIWKQIFLLPLLKTIPETDIPSSLPSAEGNACVVAFSGWTDYFRSLNDHHVLIRDEFKKICRPSHVKAANSFSDYEICIHVRLGDFRVAKSADQFKTDGSLRSPLTWFIETLNKIRFHLQRDANTLVVSDGSEEELTPLLLLKNVRLARGTSALSDLIILSRGKILIGSGGSSFTAWATFLGRMPTVVIPGQALAWFNLEVPETFVGVFDPASPDESFLQCLDKYDEAYRRSQK